MHYTIRYHPHISQRAYYSTRHCHLFYVFLILCRNNFYFIQSSTITYNIDVEIFGLLKQSIIFDIFLYYFAACFLCSTISEDTILDV